MNLISFLLVIIFVLLIFIMIAYKLGLKLGSIEANNRWQLELPNQRRDAINRSRSVLTGNFSEQLAPYLPDFKYSPTECRFIGKPVDLIVFKGADNKEIEEVIFVEVKSQNSELNNQQKNLKKVIQNKKVKWEEYRPNIFKKEDKTGKE